MFPWHCTKFVGGNAMIKSYNTHSIFFIFQLNICAKMHNNSQANVLFYYLKEIHNTELIKTSQFMS